MSAPTLAPPEPSGAVRDVPASDTPDHATSPPPVTGARWAAVVAVLAALVAALALPVGPLQAGEFASLVQGPLEVREGDGWRTVAVGDGIVDGADLRAVGGAVTLDADGDRIVLASGVRAEIAAGRLVLERGSVLVDDVADRTVQVDGITASGQGTWRVDAGSQSRIATYAGEVVADDGSTEVVLPAYRQVTARDRTVGGAARLPLRYLATDPFDREQLGEAFRVDDLALALGRSLTSTYGTAPREVDFYAAFVAVDTGVEAQLPDLALVSSGGRFGPPSEVLVGVSVADAVATLTTTPVAEAAAEVASMREQGAGWGLLLVAAGGGADDFNAAADRALEQAATDPPPTDEPAPDVSAAEDDAPADVAPPTTPPPGATGGAGGGAGGGTGGSGDGGGTGSQPAPTPPPSNPLPDPTDPGGVLAPVEDAVRDLGSGLAEVVEDTTDTVGDVVGGVDELLAPTVRGLLGGG